MKPLVLLVLAGATLPLASVEAQPPNSDISVFAPPTMQVWSARMTRRLESQMEYPRFMVPGDVPSGFLRVRFSVDGDGNLRNARIVKRSGSKLIDKSALYAVSKLDRVSATPRELDASRDIEAHLFFASTRSQLVKLIAANKAYTSPEQTNVASSRKPIILASAS